MSSGPLGPILETLADLQRNRDFSGIVEVVLNSGVIPEDAPELGVELVAAWNKLRRDQDSLQLANRLIASFPKETDPTRWRRLHVLRAMTLTRLGRIGDAEKDVELVLHLGNGSLDRLTAEATDLTGIVFNMKGQWDKADLTFRRALAQYKLLGYSRGIAAANHNLGMTLCFRQQYTEAEQRFIAATSYFFNEGTDVDHIATSVERAAAVLGLGDIGRAESLVEWGLLKAREIRADNMLGDALRVGGTVFGASKKFAEASAAFSEAKGHASRAGNRHLLGEIAEASGDMAVSCKDAQTALWKYDEAQNLYAEVGAVGFVSRVGLKIQSIMQS